MISSVAGVFVASADGEKNGLAARIIHIVENPIISRPEAILSEAAEEDNGSP